MTKWLELELDDAQNVGAIKTKWGRHTVAEPEWTTDNSKSKDPQSLSCFFWEQRHTLLHFYALHPP